MTSRESVQLAFILVLSALLLQGAVSADDTNWPQWRGPGGQGISPETGLPIEWSKGANVRWVADIEGRGHSSPAVWGDNVFVTTAIEGHVVPGAKPVVHIDDGEVFLHPDSMGATHSHTFKVLCLDAETGKVRWERVAYEGTVYDDRHRMSSYASPTPATDGRHVYVYFGSEGLYCYDLNGNLVWKRHLGGVATFGMGVGTSPFVYRSMVILQVDENTGERSFITALDKGTGDEVKREPPTFHPISSMETIFEKHLYCIEASSGD